MIKITNKARRRLGVPSRPAALILNPDESTLITQGQLDEIRKNRIADRWLETGVLVVSDDDHEQPEKTKPERPKRPTGINRVARGRNDEREVQKLPKGIEGKGTEIHHKGGGWYEVYVNGFAVTDHNVRKDEAKTIAAEYEK